MFSLNRMGRLLLLFIYFFFFVDTYFTVRLRGGFVLAYISLMWSPVSDVIVT